MKVYSLSSDFGVVNKKRFEKGKVLKAILKNSVLLLCISGKIAIDV